MESSIGEFPKIGKFPTLRSPDKSRKNSPALQTNSEIFQGEPLRGEFVENVCSWPSCKMSESLYCDFSSKSIGPENNEAI